MYGCYLEVIFHFVTKAILFLCFFGFDIYPYTYSFIFKVFFIILVYNYNSIIQSHDALGASFIYNEACEVIFNYIYSRVHNYLLL